MQCAQTFVRSFGPGEREKERGGLQRRAEKIERVELGEGKGKERTEGEGVKN